jgi:peroxiredoxin
LKFWDNHVPEIEACGSKLFAIAPEKIEICREFKAASGIRFELLSDSDNKVAAMYGLVYELPKAAREKLSSFGTDADCGPDYRRRLEPEAVLAALS